MNKICKVLSTIVIIVAIVFVYYYFAVNGTNNKALILERPSYYVLSNYWKVFLSGIIALFIGLICSFLSWLKKHDTVDILPNAGYADKGEVNTWIKGTSLDTNTEDYAEEKKKSDNAEVLNKCDSDDSTEIERKDEVTEVSISASVNDDKTEIVNNEGNAEDDKTEVLSGMVDDEDEKKK